MTQTIGNPLSWAAHALFGTGKTVATVAETLGGETRLKPRTKAITTDTIRQALRAGLDDFSHFRSDVLFLVAIYPVIGIALAFVAFDRGLLPLLFPMAAGFALLGPVAGIGLYEMSRRREAGDPNVGWGAAFSVLRADTLGPVLALGAYLLVLFVGWMLSALLIYNLTLGPGEPASLGAFANAVFTTAAGWQMIVFGMVVGFVFALAALLGSLVSFPMLIDKSVGLPLAVATSVQLARENPVAVGLWGITIAVLLALGSLPFFLGLIVVIPVLGHATWHFYRAAIDWDSAAD